MFQKNYVNIASKEKSMLPYISFRERKKTE